MSIFPIFSKRNRVKDSDIYRYDNIPIEFRRQVIHIWVDSIGVYREQDSFGYRDSMGNNEAWRTVHKSLCKEYGVFHLGNEHKDPYEQCEEFIQICRDEEVLDIIEITFQIINIFVRRMSTYQRDAASIEQDPDNAIEELNERFKEHGLGFQFIGNEIVRVDSQLTHQEIIKPTIHLLHDENFKGCEDEFLKAHEHYRHGRNKEAINEALKSFESCLKEICTRKKWPFPTNATSRALIDLVIKNNLIATELLSHFSGLRATLEAGVPTVRNSNAGHGQGAAPTEVPSYLVAYTLNITASALLLFINAYKGSR